MRGTCGCEGVHSRTCLSACSEAHLAIVGSRVVDELDDLLGQRHLRQLVQHRNDRLQKHPQLNVSRRFQVVSTCLSSSTGSHLNAVVHDGMPCCCMKHEPLDMHSNHLRKFEGATGSLTVVCRPTETATYSKCGRETRAIQEHSRVANHPYRISKAAMSSAGRRRRRHTRVQQFYHRYRRVHPVMQNNLPVKQDLSPSSAGRRRRRHTVSAA